MGICQEADLLLFVPRVAAALGAAVCISCPDALSTPVVLLTPAMEQTRATGHGRLSGVV